MINVDELLAPVRGDAPCGDDPWASGALAELETMAQGKPETQFSAAEEADWVRLRARAVEVAGTTKDLRVATILAAAVLRTDGLPGFRSALKLIHGYAERFWPDLFPLLDASANNDPSERINAVDNLAAPLGTDGDLLKIVQSLRRIPIVVAPQAGRFSFEHYLAARGQLTWSATAGPAPTPALLEAAKQEMGAAAVQAVAGTVRGILADLDAIGKLFRDKAGATHYPVFEPLRRDLQQIGSWLGGTGVVPELTASEAVVVDTVGESAPGDSPLSPASPSATGTPGVSGVVRNRADVLRALESVISYYQRSEPSSPVPFLLQRVVRIVPMDFLAVMNELTPEAREKIVAVLGAIESSTPNP